MELTLSAPEIAGLQAALRTLLTPLDYSTAEAWALEVSRTCNSLLGMDKGGMLLPLDGRTTIHSAEFPRDMMTRYVDQYYHSNRADVIRRKLGLRVWNRKSIWPMEDLKRTDYYADVVLPMRHFDAAGMSTALDVAGEEAVVYLSREVPDSIHTGARELTLLELLQPAFAAGVRALRAAEQGAATLRGLVEGLEAPIAIFDRSGLLQHAGAAFIAAIEADPQGQEVWESARGLAVEVSGICYPARAGELKLCRGLAQRRVNTGSGHYRLRGTMAEAGDGRPHVLVALELAGGRAPLSRELQQRFKLTPREADVALLLGAGRNNREIAEQLGCSGHTARRHTERVLAKLEVSCRAKVAAVLARL